MHAIFLDQIKKFEGYTAHAKPDYTQYSNGFGTKALYPGEIIDRAEAERRFASEISEARQFVERHAPHMDEGTKAALTSLTFNAGTRWASSGLGDAVRGGDLQAIAERFVQYTKAGGKDLPGLVSRRLAEVTWIGRPVDLDAQPLQMNTASAAVTAGPATTPQTARSWQSIDASATNSIEQRGPVTLDLVQTPPADRGRPPSVALTLALAEALTLMSLTTALRSDRDSRLEEGQAAKPVRTRLSNPV